MPAGGSARRCARGARGERRVWGCGSRAGRRERAQARVVEAEVRDRAGAARARARRCGRRRRGLRWSSFEPWCAPAAALRRWRGSLSGSSGRRRSATRTRSTQMPPMPLPRRGTSTTWPTVRRRGAAWLRRRRVRLRSVAKLGPSTQNRSTSRMTSRRQRDHRQRPGVPLGPPPQQQDERHEEVEHHQQQRHVLPAVCVRVVVGRLLGDVARPDDQELRERQVRPQHDERQQQVAQVVEMPTAARPRAAGAGHRRQQHDHDRQRPKHLPDDEQQAERAWSTSRRRGTSPSRPSPARRSRRRARGRAAEQLHAQATAGRRPVLARGPAVQQRRQPIHTAK
jgi:hypothetical protein